MNKDCLYKNEKQPERIKDNRRGVIFILQTKNQ